MHDRIVLGAFAAGPCGVRCDHENGYHPNASVLTCPAEASAGDAPEGGIACTVALREDWCCL